ncbi:MAG: 3-oxoacyl-ACP reductase FabG [Candidatus Korobacteraceae bacterium]|jgi:3-oxoacyl-[acyl-carrier protein] reductase
MRDTGLKHKVVIITGTAAGIGRATALRFAEEGAKIAGWDVSDKAFAEIEREIASAGGEALLGVVNVTDGKAVEAAVAEVVAKWGRIDVLVNNAGITRDSQLVKYKDGAVQSVMSDEQFDSVISVNLRAVFVCTRAVVPRMIANNGGVILSASSVVGLYGNFGQTNYVATKAGVIGMTRTWARELGRYKIRVNAVAPGFIGTEMVRAMPSKVVEGMVSRTPIGRLGEPEDVANAYAWLASEQASFISGAVLSVDGGIVIGT